jgi:hypothetical protein
VSDWHTVTAARDREARESSSTRKARGIVHTPRELATWAMRRVDEVLRHDFELGLLEPGVCLLDPAVGTGIWLEAALQTPHAHPHPHLHPQRWLAFDVDEHAVGAAHGLLSPACAARGIELSLRTANTLELASPWSGDEVRVIVGNPPWAARSLSRGSVLSDAWLADFQRDAHDQPLNERRAGVLSDDYVRFFRWALEQLRTAPRGGVVCFATNSSFLDGPVHRGMRARLLEVANRIEVLDLGGNALLARSGARDDNVFGVRVGAALSLLVRSPLQRATIVSYRRLSGSRDHKLHALSHDELPTPVVHVPRAPLLRFLPTVTHAEPAEGFSLDEAFPFHREGVQTNRDALAVATTREELLTRLAAIVAGDVLLTASRHLDPELARARLRDALAGGPAPVAELAYRPLDTRFVCTVAPLCHRPRPELQAAVGRSSFCLASVRKDRGAAPFSLFAPLVHTADSCFLSVRSSCRTRVFPSHTPEGEENLGPRIHEELCRRLGRDVSARELLAHALGVLAAESFRRGAGESLKHDYPRLPWPRSEASFAASAAAGFALHAALHGAISAAILRVDADPAHIVDVLHTRAYPSEGRLELGAAGNLREIPKAAFHVHLGHHALLSSSLKSRRRFTVGELVQVMQRACAWEAALATAEAAFTSSQ